MNPICIALMVVVGGARRQERLLTQDDQLPPGSRGDGLEERMSNHAPAPWQGEEYFLGDLVVFDAKGNVVATIDLDYQYTYDHRETAYRNRDLIAAAPELLEAADWLLHLHHGVSKSGERHITDDEWRDALEAVKQAITKAKEGA